MTDWERSRPAEQPQEGAERVGAGCDRARQCVRCPSFLFFSPRFFFFPWPLVFSPPTHLPPHPCALPRWARPPPPATDPVRHPTVSRHPAESAHLQGRADSHLRISGRGASATLSAASGAAMRPPCRHRPEAGGERRSRFSVRTRENKSRQTLKERGSTKGAPRRQRDGCGRGVMPVAARARSTAPHLLSPFLATIVGRAAPRVILAPLHSPPGPVARSHAYWVATAQPGAKWEGRAPTLQPMGGGVCRDLGARVVHFFVPLRPDVAGAKHNERPRAKKRVVRQLARSPRLSRDDLHLCGARNGSRPTPSSCIFRPFFMKIEYSIARPQNC